MRIISALYKLCFALFCWSMALTCFAAPSISQLESARDQSLAYIIKQQNGDGSWGKTSGEKIRLTSAVLDTFTKYSVNGVVYRRGINWLANAEAFTVDDLARQIYTLNTAKINTVAMSNKLIAFGVTTTTQGTRWGTLDDHRYTIIDSALAIQALSAAYPSHSFSPALTYIMGLRNTSLATSVIGSGWGYSETRFNTKSPSNVLPTAQMILLLRRLGGSYWTNLDSGAAKWLALQRKTNGVIADKDLQADVSTALSVQALGYAKDRSGAAPEVLASYQTGLDYLIARQSTNGSIDNNVYKTALLAQALFNVNQTLDDTDADGIPNLVESRIGTNNSAVDTGYLETGNGNNNTDTVGGFHFTELLVNRAAMTQLDTKSGTMVISGGVVPPGLVFNSANKTLTGTPTRVGNYTISYRITLLNGSVYLGSALIRVAAPASDTDDDGIPASYEIIYPGVLSNLNSNDAVADSDGDGLTNLQEYSRNGNPTSKDTDGDGLSDLTEYLANTSLVSSDTDMDGMTDYYEYFNGLNPNADDDGLDSDNDGLTNYQEFLKDLPANNPDADGDGILDGLDPHPRFNVAVFVAIMGIILN